MSQRPRAMVCIALALALAGCSQSPSQPQLVHALSATASQVVPGDGGAIARIAPAPGDISDLEAGGPGIVDLTVGNHGVYSLTTRKRTTMYSDGVPGPWITSPSERIDHTISAPRDLPGSDEFVPADYMTYSEFYVKYGGPLGQIDEPVRQDRTGYYRFHPDETGGPAGNVIVNGAATPAGQRPGEIPLLTYPLRPGQTWATRNGNPVYVVAGREDITVPAGRFSTWRVISGGAPQAPTDDWSQWWGAPGEVKHVYRTFNTLHDANNQIIGVEEDEEIFELVSWTHGAVSAGPTAGRVSD